MLPSGINKIIEEYCHYKPDYLSDLEWWDPKTINNWLAEFYERTDPSSFLFCDRKCRKNIKYGASELDLCIDCTDELYSTYICFYVNRVCYICGAEDNKNPLSTYYCKSCDKHYCHYCYDICLDIDDEDSDHTGTCEDCLEKINSNTSFLIVDRPCIFPEQLFLINNEKHFESYLRNKRKS